MLMDLKFAQEALIRHPGVQLAAAIGRPDPAKGELPIAFVQLKPGATTTVEELLDLCGKEVLEGQGRTTLRAYNGTRDRCLLQGCRPRRDKRRAARVSTPLSFAPDNHRK